MRRRLLFLALLAFSAAALAWAVRVLAQTEPPQEPLPLRAALAEQEARLATSNTFYLELDLSHPAIKLCQSGVALATYPIDSLKVGYPRVLFFPRVHEGRWIGEIWTGGHLIPPKIINRIRITPGSVPSAEIAVPALIPPTMSDLIPVPPVYTIVFDGGRVIRVNLNGKIVGAVGQPAKERGWWADFLAGLGLRRADSLRISASMPASDGASLFRSFPDKPPELLILP